MRRLTRWLAALLVASCAGASLAYAQAKPTCSTPLPAIRLVLDTSWIRSSATADTLVNVKIWRDSIRTRCVIPKVAAPVPPPAPPPAPPPPPPAPPPPVTGGACTNRPAAFSTTVESFTAEAPVPGGSTGSERSIAGSGFTVIYDGSPGQPSNFTAISDPTEPISPPSAWHLVSPAGVFATGHGSGNLGRPIPSGDVYVCYSFLWSANFQWNTTSTKHLRLYPGVLIQALNNGRWMRTEELNLAWGVEDPLLSSTTWVNTPLTRGVWHINELLVIRGNPGTVKIWVDGQLRTSMTSQPISPSTSTEFSIDGHLGGGGMTVTAPMYYRIGHVLVAIP